MLAKDLKRFIPRVVLVIGGAGVALCFLTWYFQIEPRLSCQANFDKAGEHNGYIQFDLVSQHPTEEYFDVNVFLYYPNSQEPPEEIALTRLAAGDYAPRILRRKLVDWSRGKAFTKPSKMGLPTSGISHRSFPFDSPHFEFAIDFNPPLRPQFIRFRNRMDDFVLDCSSFSSSWTSSGRLQVEIQINRNPFVQLTVVLLCLAASFFGLLLSQIRETQTLATATASYFFSVWSVRGIVSPAIHTFPTTLDLWLMVMSCVVFFVVTWRLAKECCDSID